MVANWYSTIRLFSSRQ
uniref:Uncharacterized protein n=1 Tax=Arundo donax TaxID=35708 RepID=A0A0A9C2H5_ARUDO